ncbi:phosphotransferase [Frankia sp. AgB1.8]|uniref:phosphotransferase n=1 Tax=Frankia sp. AgB1.8 TaxID=2792839 RepID=UPI001933CBA0|nr:phosphotransferase [Frankia sp. AgB1.8]MBL7620152.1 phosphotransferase [Frankia sp. AgB1.8]
MTVHPSAEDYIKAVQRPSAVFDRPELAAAEFDVHPMLGVPIPVSGSTAVVFRAQVGDTAQALRFFTREDAATRQRYTALNEWFTERGLAADVASCRWVDDAILVNGRRWPMVQMEWVDGHPLDRHVEDLVETGDRAALGTLADSWRELLRRTQAARFAHGDLQHGNVLVDTESRLRLVDFDSAWIAPFEGLPPPSEGGHRNYQPENRLWGPWMDTFPGLVIYLSLLALARDPRQWEQLNDGENLLFGHQDYLPPHRTEAWSWVARLQDERINQLAARLRACCAPGWTATGDLEGLISGPAPWWTRTTVLPRVGAPPEPAPTPSTAPPRPRVAPDSQPTGQPTQARQPTQPTLSGWPTQPGPAGQPRQAGPPPTRLGPPTQAGQPTSTGNPTWWQQSTRPQPGPAVPIPPQPPAAARRPPASHRRGLGARGAALLVWLFCGGLISGLIESLAGHAAGPVPALVALVPAMVVLVVLIRKSRGKPR